MRQRRHGVRNPVIVLRRGNGHRLGDVPGLRGEGQHVAAQRGSRQAQVRAVVSRNGDRHAVRGLGGQRHRVAHPRGVSLRHGEVRLAEHDIRTVIVGDRDRQILGDVDVVPARSGVGQRRHSVRNPVVVLRRG